MVLLASQSLTVGAITANFDSARPTISKHLQVLAECELITQEKVGREIYYHLNAVKMKEVDQFVEQFRALWEVRFNKLEAVMKQYQVKKAK